MRIVAMTRAYAGDIITWRYPPPYDCYDMTCADPDALLDPAGGFFALVEDGRLIGYRSFGPDGQVPGGWYDDSALDTGGGLRPQLTGQGLGREVIRTGLEFGWQRFDPPAFRVTIASFNVRAQRVVGSLGFRNVGRFDATTNGWSYEVLMLPEQSPG